MSDPVFKRIASGPGFIVHTSCILTGSGQMGGKTYYWEFNPMFGPTFTRKDGEFLSKQPGVRSNAWKCWQKWYDELQDDTHEGNQIARMNKP